MSTLDLRRFSLWNEQLAGIAACDDPHQLPGLLMEALCTLANADMRSILVFSENRKPLHLCEEHGPTWPTDDLGKYLDSAYLLDPYYRAGVDGIEAGLYHISDLAPTAFKDSEYFKVYYEASPLEDEIGFITYLGDGCFANYSLVRAGGTPPFSEDEMALLRSTQALVDSLLIRYWNALPEQSRGAGSELHAQLEGALSIFGTSVLTPRESEVMRMYLYGHDTRSISERLQISAHTVSAHRKHAYARLDITSQAELFSLFINSMYCFDGNPERDPLESYLQAPD